LLCREERSLSRAFRVAALLFTALALAMVFWATRLRWTKPADFDVVGFLWLFQNAGRISAIVFAAIFGGMAIYCWIRAALER
jgi:hypothetical protein